MAYSTIKRKPCKCGTQDNPCELWPTSGYEGWNWAHAPEEVLKKKSDKKKKQIKNSNARKSASMKIRKDSRPVDELTGETVKEIWFRERRKEMTGKCICGCFLMSSKNDDKYFRFSIAHVLPKNKFISIAFHPENWVELSYWNGCHGNFDNKGYEWCKIWMPQLFKEVVRKFIILYPFIAEQEKKHIPDILRQFIGETQDTPVEQAISTKLPV